ncbi:MAG: cytochrome c [Phycisphaerales bacterium]|nr:cytochrome c [Phycisphaerales bacterium]
MPSLLFSVALVGVALILVSGCGSQPVQQAEGAVGDSSESAPTPAPFERPGLHNVVWMSPKVYSGSVPDGEAGFDSLAAMGIRTVISVDGARPDLDRAGARGMRYVHIPIQYSGVREEAAVQLAAAVRDLPGPIYVHCHHGKHRGPAAACLALVESGAFSAERGVELLKTAGTSQNYQGLYEAVGCARAIDPSSLDGVAATLAATAPVPGFVSAMSGLEHVMEHLRAIEGAGWKAPEDHPDLAPASEAGLLHDLFRAARDDSVNEADADDFAAWMRVSLDQSRELEEALSQGDGVRASAALGAVAQTCTDCHNRYRNPGK